MIKQSPINECDWTERLTLRRGHHHDDDDDDAVGHVAHVGAVIEEVSRLMELVSPDNLAAEGGAAALAATVEAVLEMVEGALDAAGEAAWNYPPPLAGRMYAQLLRAAFDPLAGRRLLRSRSAHTPHHRVTKHQNSPPPPPPSRFTRFKGAALPLTHHRCPTVNTYHVIRRTT